MTGGAGGRVRFNLDCPACMANMQADIDRAGEPEKYLSRAEVAALVGVKPDTLGRYKLPPPDALVGDVRGWHETTIRKWHESRPGSGRGGK